MLDLVEMEVRELLNKYKFDGDNAKVVRGAALPGAQRRREVGSVDRRAARRARHADPGAGSRHRQAVPDGDRGRVLDQGPRHGGHGSRRARHREDGRRGRDHRLPRHAQDASSRASRCSASCSTRGRRATTSASCSAASRRTTSSAARSSPSRARSRRTRSSMGEVYVLKKEEGGRHTPFFTNYRPQFYMRTTDVTGTCAAARGHQDGHAGRQHHDDDRAHHAGRLSRSRCASPSARAAAPSAPASSPRSSSLKESRQHMACDHQDSHPPQGVRSPAPRQVGQRHRRDREAHRRARGGAHPAAHAHLALHRPPRPARRQEVARAVRDPHPQAPARHPRADAADARRADEARPVAPASTSRSSR